MPDEAEIGRAAEAVPDAARPRLTCWKDVADFFDRDVRTVQRWEKREGLPVHRLHHARGGSVYALAEELEAWRQARSLPPAEASAILPAAEAKPVPPVSAQSPGRQLGRMPARLSRLSGLVQLGIGAAVLLGILAIWWSFRLGVKPPTSADQRIAEKLRQRFAAHPDLAAVRAQSWGGVVTLSGSVPNYRAVLEANHDALLSEDVTGVVDKLKVDSQTVSDAALAAQLSQLLKSDALGTGRLKRVIFRVSHGAVELSGRTASYADRDLAFNLAVNLMGVRRVVDDIAVNPPVPIAEPRVQAESGPGRRQ